MRTLKGLLPIAAIASILALPAIAFSQGTVYWQIGKCDGSWAEFGMAGHQQDYKRDFPGGATFEVGKGDPAKNWVYVQPGPDDSQWAGEGEHPFEVVFDLDSVPVGPLLLQIDLVDVSPTDAPTMRVRVNDTIRFFELEPGTSSDSLTDPAKGRKQTIRMYLAGGFLTKGRNVVNLTITKGSYALYDCISMAPCDRTPHAVEDVSLRPTYLFKDTKDGLRQIVYGALDLYPEHATVHAELAGAAGWRVAKDFEDLSSGRHNLEIEIPPVSKQEAGRLKISVGSEVVEKDVEILPQKRWKIYLAPSAHFDYGYTAAQDKVMQIHRANVDRAIDWCAKYPGSGWNLEGSFIAEDYIENGSRRDDFIRLAKSGRLGVMGFFASELTGICSSEGLSRAVEYYDFLDHKYGIHSDCAMQNDVPSMVGTVPMILREHGIKYLSWGTNWVRAGADVDLVRNPFYWEASDGSKVLVYWSGGIYFESLEISGFDKNGSDDPALTLPRVNKTIDSYLSRKQHPFDAVYLHGAYCDNVDNDDTLARVVDKWNATYAYPKIIFCRGSEYLRYIEKHFPDSIRTVKGDFGVWWEDGVASSARETADARVAEQRLVTAEKLTSLCGPQFASQVRDDFSRAWKNVLLYNEHTWGAFCSVDDPQSPKTLEQWVVKKSFADKARDLSGKLLDGAMNKLCAGIRPKTDSVVVFNPSSWPRSERVSFLDADGKLRTLLADAVPPLGYKVFPVAKAAPDSPKLDSGNVLDNRYYTIKFDPATGAVSSLYDKQLKRELVDPAQPYKMNQYLYVAGGKKGSWGAPAGEKLDISTQSNPVLTKLTMPGRQIMRAVCTAANARSFISEVVIYDDCKRIDFTNTLDKVETTDKEAVYFAFPFAFRQPNVRLEIPDGVIRPEADQLKGACKNWFCAQQFVTLADQGAAVTWTAIDSPLITFGDINRGNSIANLKLDNGSVFAYVMNNYWFTNYKASQGGPMTFRFAITSARSATDASAKRFGESAQSPLVARLVRAVPAARNRPTVNSFVDLAGDGLIVQTLRPARFSNGTIVRLREMNGRNTAATLRISGIQYSRAFLCNIAEDRLRKLDAKNGSISVPCRAFGLATVLLER